MIRRFCVHEAQGRLLLGDVPNTFFAGFRPIKGVDDYFHGAALKSEDKLHPASHVRDVKEGDDLDVKCCSQQGKQLYEIILHVNNTCYDTKIEVTELPP